MQAIEAWNRKALTCSLLFKPFLTEERAYIMSESLQMNHSQMGRDNKWFDNFGFLKWYKPLSLLFELGFLNMQIIGINLDTFTKRINQWISEKK